MARIDPRAWSPVRMPPRQEGELGGQTLHCAYDAGVDGDQELVDRVMKWLEESKPPRLDRPRSSKLSKDPKKFHSIKANELIDMGSDLTDRPPDLAADTILYHPDFADWSCVQHQEEKKQIQSMQDFLLFGMKLFQI